jgi:sugar/nucleoside kinase (ribokinase family)
MVAAALAELGPPVLLLANDIGDDATGARVHAWLRHHRVRATSGIEEGLRTPQIVVVGDDHHTRTIFPYLPGVADGLERIDLAPLASAPFAYIAGYDRIGKAASLAIRAARAARAARVPLLLNLGGDSSPEVLDAVRGYPGLIVQTSTEEGDAPEAQRLAGHLQDETAAQWAVVTARATGAVAVSGRESLNVPAFRANVRHTHCAGAAFSAGFTYGLLHDWPMPDSLELAAALGALRCERGHDEPMPSLGELQAFIGSRQCVTKSTA